MRRDPSLRRCVILAILATASTAVVATPRSSVHRTTSRHVEPANVAGEWALTVETAQGSGNPTVTLQQEGETLTGHYSSSVFGEQKVTGTVKDSGITFSFTASFQGTSLVVTYRGTVEEDTMKGTVTVGDLGEGTFTGKRR